MTRLDGLESWILAYLLNSLWQVPVVFLAALIAAKLARPAGPRMEHRVWVGALLLQAILPACRMPLGELSRQAWGLVLWFRHSETVDGQTRVVLGTGKATQAALPWHTAELLALVAFVYAAGLLYFAARLGWALWTTETMRRRSSGIELTKEMTCRVDRFEQLLGLTTGDVRFASSAAFSGPATVGIRCPTLLLPAGFLETLSPAEQDALLAHEFAHMRRWDFAKNLLYGLISLPIAYHPLLGLTRTRLAETRELICDAMAAEAVGGREGYARSLLRLASMLSDRSAPRILHAIGILDANIFERRVMNLTRRSFEIRGVRRAAIAAGCALLGLLTCGSALALRMDVNQPSAKVPAPNSVHVKSDSMTVVNKVNPVYPVEAKKARVMGTVVLAATIGKTGSVEKLRVVSGPSLLQQSAVDAVKQWRYQPFLLNGNPVDVKTDISVVYTLKK